MQIHNAQTLRKSGSFSRAGLKFLMNISQPEKGDHAPSQCPYGCFCAGGCCVGADCLGMGAEGGAEAGAGTPDLVL
jgi:hypothetical protein